MKVLENQTSNISWKGLALAVAVAAALWFYMFSPWTAGVTNFWVTMSAAAVILTATALLLTRGAALRSLKCERPLLQLLLGVALAFALWGIFWLGDRLSSLMFDFARPQVDAVYSMKQGFPAWLIALLLLLVVGPAEEFFWRGFVQKELSSLISGWRFSADHAFLITVLVYGLVHVWSFNFMLVMAALVAGAVWGFIYRLQPRLLPALIVSHALWDALVFVILPI